MYTNRVGDDVVCVQMWFVYIGLVNRVGDDVVCVQIVQIGMVTMWVGDEGW